MSYHSSWTRKHRVPAVSGLVVCALVGLAVLGCGPPDHTANIDISLDPDTGQPVVDPDPVIGYRGARVQWKSTLGADTAWLVRLLDESPFRDNQMQFESRPNPQAYVGGVILPTADTITPYRYVVKLIVNEGRDTLGADPEIHVRDPSR